MQQAKNQVGKFDKSLTRYTQKLPKHFKPLLKLASFIGRPLGIIALLISVLGFATLYHVTALQIAAGLALVSLSFSSFLKQTFRRQRPETYIPEQLYSHSFPSGHAYMAVLTFGLIGWFVFRGFESVTGLYLAIFGPLLIGVSRVYLGAHYPSDVVVGWMLGVIVLSAIISITGI
jgi:undecaprenyl-diphosphatase